MRVQKLQELSDALGVDKVCSTEFSIANSGGCRAPFRTDTFGLHRCRTYRELRRSERQPINRRESRRHNAFEPFGARQRYASFYRDSRKGNEPNRHLDCERHRKRKRDGGNDHEHRSIDGNLHRACFASFSEYSHDCGSRPEPQGPYSFNHHNLIESSSTTFLSHAAAD
jgi:hypothetical protein